MIGLHEKETSPSISLSPMNKNQLKDQLAKRNKEGSPPFVAPDLRLFRQNIVHTGMTGYTNMGDSIDLPKPHVCIVGTGIAGLRCAGVLLEKAVRVTMLEARNRIGGRV